MRGQTRHTGALRTRLIGGPTGRTPIFVTGRSGCRSPILFIQTPTFIQLCSLSILLATSCKEIVRMARLQFSQLMRLVHRPKKLHQPSTPSPLQDENTDSKDLSPEPPKVGLSYLPIEVLQQILSYLPCLSLLKYRTVCRLWSACIPGDSHQLREVMYLQTKTVTIATDWPPLDLYFEIYTDMKRAKNQSYFSTDPHISAVTRVTLSHASKAKLRLNPFVLRIDRYISAEVPSLGMRADELQFTYLKNLRGGLLRPDDISLFKDMLVTMRPVSELHLHFSYMDRDFEPIPTNKNMKNCILFDKEGVRLVELLDIIEQQVAGLLRGEMLRRIKEADNHHAHCMIEDKVVQIRCPIQIERVHSVR